MKLGWIIFIFLSNVLLQSCDTGISITHYKFRDIASETVEKLNGNETLPKGIKTFLTEEQRLIVNRDVSTFDSRYTPEANPKFPLAYYLIPDTDAKFVYANSIDPKVRDQLSIIVSGTTYFKFFIHPRAEVKYDFLKNAYRYIGPSETEFMASPTFHYRSVVVWNRLDPYEVPFIAKLSIDKNIMESDDRVISEADIGRAIKTQQVFDKIGKEKLEKLNVKVFPESSGLIFKRRSNDSFEKFNGQLIKEIPQEIMSGKKRWLSFASLLRLNQNSEPVIFDVIKKSNLTSYEFFDRYMIAGYLKTFEALSLKNRINFEPQPQNLMIETDLNFKPTGKWILRDLGEGRGNYISNYTYFYKKQIFDVLLDSVAKVDSSLTIKKVAELKSKIDSMYFKQIKEHDKQTLKESPGLGTYKKIENVLIEHVSKTNDIEKKLLEDTHELRAFIERKIANQEWIEFFTADKNIETTFFMTDHGVYQIDEDTVIGIALLKPNELILETEKEKNSFTLPRFLRDFQYRPSSSATCHSIMRKFFILSQEPKRTK